MKESLATKLDNLSVRLEEINVLLSDPETMSNQNKFRELSQEHAQITPVVEAFIVYQEAEESLAEAIVMRKEEKDPELLEMAEEEINDNKKIIENMDKKLQVLLLPKDPNDDSNIFLELRAGTGGDEAAIFVGDLFKMYSRYAEILGWKVSVVSESASDKGGFKEIIARVDGHGAYSRLKFESGAHRVQRVPATESQGRVHTSAATVAIIPEAKEVDAIDINPADLRIDTFRASGAGGQHVNKTDSAVRITHIPSGMVVECQDERSQHKNKARALSLLSSRMMQFELDKQHAEESENRKNLVGSGDRSDRIRTYNYPQGRVTDHRINLTLHKLDDIMSGDLNHIIEPLIQEHQADLLTEISE